MPPETLDAGPRTLVDVLRARAATEPDRRMFTYLGEDQEVAASLTAAELDRRARAIAAELRECAEPGDRAMLHYGPGLEFVSAFFGCLYAGLIAVPVAPLEAGRRDIRNKRLPAIARSATPRVVMSTAASLLDVGPELKATEGLEDVERFASDLVDSNRAESWEDPAADPSLPAYLQYSSGSTGTPKGVVLTHRAVLSNLALIHENGSRDAGDGRTGPPAVLWLPLFHDMGLVNGILQPLYAGYDVTLMSPLAFVHRPFTWLWEITRAGRALSVAPNFAFDLCVRRVTERQRARLDLSGWELAAVGAEPVRADTLDRFCAAFGPVGFRREVFFPCYGLAESTVMVSGGPAGREPVVRAFDAESLARSRIRPATPGSPSRALVGCGQIQPTVRVVIVDPATGEVAAPDEVGEILVAGDSVGSGYWNAPDQDALTFRARVPGHGDQDFLRTGDLGFVLDGQLFITGRRKDVIILDGLNYYPHDVEHTAAGSHPAVRERFCCAFSVDDGQSEGLVVLAEIAGPLPAQGDGEPRDGDAEEVRRAIRRAVTAEHGVPVRDVVLLRAGSLPFTSSGKVKRLECRERYLADRFAARPAV
ncbi:fatty acyl-AMP ligase [Actinosynnema sp. NPDC059797]